MQAQDSEDIPAHNALYVDQASTDELCPNLFCDLYIEIRTFLTLGAQLTFDHMEDFECLACRNYCSCSLSSQKRGETWLPSRGADLRKEEQEQRPRSGAGAGDDEAARNDMMTTTADAQVFDGSRSATAVFTVSGEPSGSAFLRGNKACIMPVSQPTIFPTAAHYTTTHTALTTITASPIPEHWEIAQDVGAARVPSGSRGRPAGEQGKSAMAGRRRRGKRIRLCVGNPEPLLVRRRRRRSASLTPLDDDDDGNLDEGGDTDADAESAYDRIWPGEHLPDGGDGDDHSRGATSSISPLPFAPSGSSSHQASKPSERANNVTAISTTGLGDDPTTSEYVIGHTPVSREDDGQTSPAPKNTDSDVYMRIVTRHDRDLGSSPFLRVRVTESAPSCGRLQALLVLAISCGLMPHFKDVPLPPLPLRNQSVRTSPYQRDRGRDHAGGHRIRQLFFLFLTTAAFSAQPAQDQETEGTGAADGVCLHTALPARRAQVRSCAPQVAFESNWPGSGCTGPGGKKAKQGD
ncbi:hypothetical protein EDB89DRAFT_2124368 [Lactarius sanguifluus]|nr:hypothetical protein EDB89DRAFT_2124368 [Lactarius sanguifluus]